MLIENTHCRKANAVEHMIVDAFVEADPFFKLADATEDAQAFALLDDSILKVRRAYAACWHLSLLPCLQEQLHIGGDPGSLSIGRLPHAEAHCQFLLMLGGISSHNGPI